MTYYIIAEYIWLDANKKFRSKTKIIRPNPFENKDYSHFSGYPKWDYDGSSTGQADGKKSEITLVPVFVCDNPLLLPSDCNIHSSKLVLCETYNQDGKPTKTNRRDSAERLFDIYKDEKPWFGLEQEYFMVDEIENKATTRGDGKVGQASDEHYKLIQNHLKNNVVF